jgi:hypothetical protein
LKSHASKSFIVRIMAIFINWRILINFCRDFPSSKNRKTNPQNNHIQNDKENSCKKGDICHEAVYLEKIKMLTLKQKFKYFTLQEHNFYLIFSFHISHEIGETD